MQRNTFLKLNACGINKFKENNEAFENEWCCSKVKNLLYLLTVLHLHRIYGNIGRKPPLALSQDELMKVISFIKNYAAVHAILLPG